MPLTTQMKMLKAVREILLGDGRNALPRGNEPKPDLITSRPAALPRSTPEQQGLSSDMLENFYREIANAPDAYAHALLVLRRGSVVCEGYFAPFRKDIWQVVHSLSKSFTGAAVGLAIEEGLFSLDDKVASFFPEKVGLFPPKYIRSITVRHLLTMSSGITFNEITEAVELDWVRGIFSSPVAFEPGSQFVYNSMNSYLLSALINKVTGHCLKDYLTPRLFMPMGFGALGWERCPAGNEKGGWGMYLTMEDMAKFGQLYLQKGAFEVDGEMRQLLPESWVAQSTKVQITSPSGEGYGYQLWVDADTGFCVMSGMFGQYISILPSKELVITMTAGNSYLFTGSPAYSLMKKYFLSEYSLPNTLPPNPVAYAKLRRTLSALRFHSPLPENARLPKRIPSHTRRDIWNKRRLPPCPVFPSQAELFCGPTWEFARNRGGFLPVIVQAMNNNFTSGIKAIHLAREKNHLLLYWEEDHGTICLPVGFESPLERKIYVGKETFLLASSAQLCHNEDEEPILIIEICLLEHSSFRTIKLQRKGQDLFLRIDEQPQFIVAVESVVRQDAKTSGSSGEQPLSLTDRLFGNDYFHYRISQLCRPALTGTPVSEEKNTPLQGE